MVCNLIVKMQMHVLGTAVRMLVPVNIGPSSQSSGQGRTAKSNDHESDTKFEKIGDAFWDGHSQQQDDKAN